MSYRIDHKRFREIAAELGVRGPVFLRRVRANAIPWDTAAEHIFSVWLGTDCVSHAIKVDGERGRAAVADSLAHELCHALQAEEAVTEGGPEAWRRIATAQRRLPHDERPIEVEAIAYGREHWRELMDCLVAS